MAVRRVRCAGCREYFAPDEKDRYTQIGLSSFCSTECLQVKRGRPRKRPNKARAVSIEPSFRRKIRTRDGNRCRWCGTTRFLQVHHIVYRSQGGPDHESNLITLCDEHHRQAHSIGWYWRPLLLGVVWLQYQGQAVSVPEVERVFGEWVRRDLSAERGMLATGA